MIGDFDFQCAGRPRRTSSGPLHALRPKGSSPVADCLRHAACGLSRNSEDAYGAAGSAGRGTASKVSAEMRGPTPSFGRRTPSFGRKAGVPMYWLQASGRTAGGDRPLPECRGEGGGEGAPETEAAAAAAEPFFGRPGRLMGPSRGAGARPGRRRMRVNGGVWVGEGGVKRRRRRP